MSFKLHVKTLAGNEYTIDVTPTQSINIVKRRLMNKILHDPNRPERFNSSAILRLSYLSNEAVELSGSKTIGDYPFLKNNSELLLTIIVEEFYADINVQIDHKESMKLITAPFYMSMKVSEFKQSIAKHLQDGDAIKNITATANRINRNSKKPYNLTTRKRKEAIIASYMKFKEALYDVMAVLNNDFELYIGRCSSKTTLMEDDSRLSDYPEMEEGVDLCIVFSGHHIQSNNSNSNSNSNSNQNYNSNGGKRRKTHRMKRTVHRKTKRSTKK